MARHALSTTASQPPPPPHKSQTGFVSFVVWLSLFRHGACCPWRRQRRCFFRHEEEACTCVKPCAKPVQPLGPTRDEPALLVAALRRLEGSVMWHQVEPVPQNTEDTGDVPVVQFTPQELCVAEDRGHPHAFGGNRGSCAAHTSEACLLRSARSSERIRCSSA